MSSSFANSSNKFHNTNTENDSVSKILLFKESIKKTITNNKMHELCYLLFIVCFTIYWELGFIMVTGQFGLIKKISAILGIGSLIISVLSVKFNKKEKKYFFVSVVLSIVIYMLTGKQYSGILTIAPTIFAIKNINLKKVITAMYRTMLSVFVIFVLLNLLNVIPHSIITKTDNFSNNYYMYALGNKHGNALYLCVFCIISMFLYNNKSKLNYLKLISSLVFIIISYCLFQSRTGLVLSIIMLIGVLLLNKFKIKINNEELKKYLYLILKCFPFVICIAVVMLSTILKDTVISETLDSIITNRLSCAEVYIYNFGISIFPRNIIDTFVLDNMYAFMLIHYGLIFVIFYCLLYYKTISKLLNNNKYMEVFFIILYGLYAYSEKVFLKIFCNFPMLLLAYLLYDNLFEENGSEENENIDNTNVSV